MAWRRALAGEAEMAETSYAFPVLSRLAGHFGLLSKGRGARGGVRLPRWSSPSPAVPIVSLLALLPCPLSCPFSTVSRDGSFYLPGRPES